MGQPIRMEVSLLDSGAEEQKDSAQDRKHERFTRLQCPGLTFSSHDYKHYTPGLFQPSPL
jgi:hypothetical protein